MRMCLFLGLLLGGLVGFARSGALSKAAQSGGGQQGPEAKSIKDAVDDKTIRALIAELGDESFVKREAAQKRLSAIGAAALPLLQTAAKESADAEVRERVEQ